MNTKTNDLVHQRGIFAWIAVATGILLLIPLISMQFTHEVDWDNADFIVMGSLIFGTSSLFVGVARVTSRKYRLIAGATFAIAFLWIWAELAVGVFTNLGS